MGSTIGGFKVNDTPGQTQEALTLSRQLGYSKSDVNKLYRAFRKMDKYKTGAISLRSYCAVNNITSAFGELIFRRMLRLEYDVDRDLSFKEYLLSSWNALSIFDNDSYSTLAFQIFDVDDSGVMTVEEVRHMIEVIYRESDLKVMSVLNVLIDNIGQCESITVDDFVVLVKNLPSLLYPVFDLIKAVRERTLGERRWLEISKLRMQPLANKLIFMNKINSGNISMSKFNNRVRSNSLSHRNGSFCSVGSTNRNSILRSSFNGREGNTDFNGNASFSSAYGYNGGSMTTRSNTRDDDINASINIINNGNFNGNGSGNSNGSVGGQNIYPKIVGRRGSAMSTDHRPSPVRMRPHSFSAMGSVHGSMGVQDAGSHNSSTNAIVYDAATNLRRSGIHGSRVQRVTYQGTPREEIKSPESDSSRDLFPKNNLDAIKVANAIHMDRMKKANSQNLNKLIEANSTLDAYKKSANQFDPVPSISSESSHLSERGKRTETKIEMKKGNREGGFTSARKFS